MHHFCTVTFLLFSVFLSHTAALIVWGREPDNIKPEKICDDLTCMCFDPVKQRVIDGTVRAKKYDIDCEIVKEYDGDFRRKKCDELFCWCEDVMTKQSIWGSRTTRKNFFKTCKTYPVGYCSMPQIENGVSWPVDGDIMVEIGQIITYKCYDGYKLVGADKNLCLNNLMFSDVHPTCVRIK